MQVVAQQDPIFYFHSDLCHLVLFFPKLLEVVYEPYTLKKRKEKIYKYTMLSLLCVSVCVFACVSKTTVDLLSVQKNYILAKNFKQ